MVAVVDQVIIEQQYQEQQELHPHEEQVELVQQQIKEKVVLELGVEVATMKMMIVRLAF